MSVPAELFLNVVWALFMLSSGLLWWQILRRLRDRQPPLVPVEHRLPRYNRWVLGLTFFWVGSQLLQQWASGPQAPADAPLPADFAPVKYMHQYFTMLTLLAVALLLLLRDVGRTSLAEFGITMKNWQQQVYDGWLGFLLSVLPVFLVLLITLPWRSENSQHEFLKLIQGHPTDELLFWIFLTAGFSAPVAEELIFRVVLQGWLTTRLRPQLAIPAIALLFCSMHNWPDSLPLFPLAIVLGITYHYRFSFLSIAVIHVLFNLTNLFLALLAGP